MKQPDNHVELGAILKEFWELAQSSPPYPWSYDLIATKQARQKLDQYYADFYRNKIPEKKIPENTPNEAYRGMIGGYNQAIDDITAQFSRGDNDE